ncbi:MAG TPA: nuclear transport factor 2 family protein, partial [Acidimicrobiales bacterium]|nr:nuclear transport factor 2 family protein [Acidimicrobiales bacterium]
MFVLGTASADHPCWAPFGRLSVRLATVAVAGLLVGGATSGTLVFGVAQRVFVGAVLALMMLTALRLGSMTPPRRDRGRNVDRLRTALAELTRGNLDPLSSLLHPRVHWNPVPCRGFEPCRSRDEVLAKVRHHLDQGFRLEDVELIESGQDVVVGFRAPQHLPLPPGARFFNAFRFKAGRVVRIEDRLERESFGAAL